jgi:hypothetical protein
MSATGLDVFDKTLQTNHSWLDEIMTNIGPNRTRVARAGIGPADCARPASDWVSGASRRSAPHPGRGLYYDQWRANEQPQKWRSLDEFLALVSADLSNVRPVNPTEGGPERCSRCLITMWTLDRSPKCVSASGGLSSAVASKRIGCKPASSVSDSSSAPLPSAHRSRCCHARS